MFAMPGKFEMRLVWLKRIESLSRESASARAGSRMASDKASIDVAMTERVIRPIFVSLSDRSAPDPDHDRPLQCRSWSYQCGLDNPPVARNKFGIMVDRN